MKTMVFNWWKKATENKKALQAKRLQEEANELYQIKEHNGELWITYDGRLFAPQSLFTEDVIAIIGNLRECYIKEKTTKL